MTVQEYIDKIRELHDILKAHPYWRVFDHGMFRNEVYDMFRDIMVNVSHIRYNKEGIDADTPILALHSMLYHNFSYILGKIYHLNGIEEIREYKEFYLPVLQNYIQLIHYFIDKIDDSETLAMYMPNDASNPTKLIKYVPFYHKEWVDDEGYKFYRGEHKWNAVMEIKEDDINDCITRLENKMETTKIESLKECYKHYIKDIRERTNFIYKIVE